MAEQITSLGKSEKKVRYKKRKRRDDLSLQAAVPRMGMTEETTATADYVEKIQKQLDKVEPYDGGDPNIFEVPSRLRDLKQPDPYTPGVVSIGPCHHKDKHLKQIEKRKWQLLQHLLLRTKKSLHDLVENMRSLLHHAKECYDKPIIEGLTDQDFLEMLLLDACFILELLHNSANKWNNCEDTSNPLHVFHQRGFIPFIRRDLLMLENQLPFSVLQKIFTFFWGPSALSIVILADQKNIATLADQKKIVTLALKFFDKVIPGISENISDNSEYEPLHLLDIVHKSLEPPKQPEPPEPPKQPKPRAVEQVSETHIWICNCCPFLRLFPCPNGFPCWQVTDHETRISLNKEGNNVSDPSPSNHAARTVLDGEILSDPPPANHATRNVHDVNGERVFHPPPSDQARRTVQNEESERMPDPSPSKHAARTIPDGKKSTISNSSKIPMHSVHSVTRLRGTGIKFEKNDSTKFTEIEFKEGKLLIPPLLIHGSTRSIFLNLMAFEQCYPDCGRHTTAYITFIDGLINSSKDVEHLIEKKIIAHQYGSEEDVATLINNLRMEMVFDTNDNYLSDISKQLNEHYEHKWQTWKTTLKHEYLKDPWKIISLVAAGLLIFLTIAQTAYTMVSYHFPKN